jgi:hypothetical protein
MRGRHDDFIKRWAASVLPNPTKWKATHIKFIDAHIESRRKLYGELSQTMEGKKLIDMYKITYLDASPSLKD